MLPRNLNIQHIVSLLYAVTDLSVRYKTAVCQPRQNGVVKSGPKIGMISACEVRYSFRVSDIGPGSCENIVGVPTQQWRGKIV